MEDMVREVMANVFGISPSEITNEASPSDIEQWDSHKHLTLIIVLEEEFGIEFEEHQIAEIMSFKLIINSLKSKMNPR